MTKKQFDKNFENEFLFSLLIKENGVIDKPLRCECYNNLVDYYTKDNLLTEKQAFNFIIPKKYLKK
jgi:hypothetical protein